MALTRRKPAAAAAPAAPAGRGGPARGASAPAPPARRGLLRRRPKKPGAGPGRIRQMRNVYEMTRRADPAVRWWLLGSVVGTLVVALGLGLLTGHPYYALFLGVPLALLAGLFVLARRAERAAYSQLEGQPGAAGAALRVLRRGWQVEEEPVAIDPRTRDTVFRALGRPGVVLVADGPAQRAGRLLETERRRVTKLLPDVPVHVLQVGRGEGQVPLGKLPRRVMRLKPQLTKAEVAVVSKRLRALGRMRLPVPKGIDPVRARPDRKAARGR
jgi:hypothetical protein